MGSIQVDDVLLVAKSIRQKLAKFHGLKLPDNDDSTEAFQRVFSSKRTPQTHHSKQRPSNSFQKNYQRLTTDQSDPPHSQPALTPPLPTTTTPQANQRRFRKSSTRQKASSSDQRQLHQQQQQQLQLQQQQNLQNQQLQLQSAKQYQSMVKDQETTVSRLNDLASKFQNMLELSQKPQAFMIERQLMSQKIEDLVNDMKICQENINDYEKVIQSLCRKHREAKRELQQLRHENQRLTAKTLTTGKLQAQLGHEKARNVKLMKKIEDLRTQIQSYFQEEILGQEDTVKEISLLKNQNEQMRSILEGLMKFGDEKKLDEIIKSPDMDALIQEHENLMEEYSRNYNMKVNEYIEDLKKKRGAIDQMDQMENLGNYENIITQKMLMEGEGNQLLEGFALGGLGLIPKDDEDVSGFLGASGHGKFDGGGNSSFESPY